MPLSNSVPLLLLFVVPVSFAVQRRARADFLKRAVLDTVFKDVPFSGFDLLSLRTADFIAHVTTEILCSSAEIELRFNQ